MTHASIYAAMILPRAFRVEAQALSDEPFSAHDVAAMERHVRLANDLRRCRYVTQEERSMRGTVHKGVTTSFEMTLPEAGATRDMLGLLRQLFGDRERSSFASMVKLLRAHARVGTPEGDELVEVMSRFELVRQGVLDSWDVQPGGTDNSPQPPLTVFLDWMYGEYLHSDADKAKRIEALNHFRLYEWQFHWVAERLAILFAVFAQIVRTALEVQPRASGGQTT